VGGVAVGHVHPLELRVSLSKTGLVHSWVLRDRALPFAFVGQPLPVLSLHHMISL
jgi:hypothetical protein